MPTSNTIADIVLSNSNGQGLGAFDILLQALSAVDPDSNGLLAAAADPSQNLTVFAPTDGAFINLAKFFDPTVSTEAGAVSALVAASKSLSPADDPAAFLRTVISYHIVPGTVTQSDIQGGAALNTLTGQSLQSDGNTIVDEETSLPDPSFVPGLTDLTADNGIVQVIDQVLIPFDITIANGFARTGNGNDIVIANGEHNSISLGRGDDIAIGSDGRDFISGGQGNDIINSNGGNDFIRAGSGDDYVDAGDGNDLIFGGRGDDDLNGGNGHDKLFGGRGNDELNGGDGYDKLFGGSGNDALDGGMGNDKLYGGRGNDLLDGGDGYDYLFGGSGSDELDGGDGNDYLSGGRGDDVLRGGSGDDMLRGGSGADKFVFNPNNTGEDGSLDEGDDIIFDFSIAQGDRLVLDVSTFDQETLDLVAGLAGDSSTLELIDLLADLDPETDGVQSVITLGESDNHNLVIGHPAGTIELANIPASIDPAALIPVVDFEFG